MICPHCKANVKVQGKFCPNCGEQVLGLPVSQTPRPATASQSEAAPEANARAQWEAHAVAYVVQETGLSEEAARVALTARSWDVNGTIVALQHAAAPAAPGSDGATQGTTAARGSIWTREVRLPGDTSPSTSPSPTHQYDSGFDRVMTGPWYSVLCVLGALFCSPLLIVVGIGGLVACRTETGKRRALWVLILGLVMLMLGVYISRLMQAEAGSRTMPSAPVAPPSLSSPSSVSTGHRRSDGGDADRMPSPVRSQRANSGGRDPSARLNPPALDSAVAPAGPVMGKAGYSAASAARESSAVHSARGGLFHVSSAPTDM